MEEIAIVWKERIGEKEATAEEIQAGAERLEDFGIMNTIYTISSGNLYHMERVVMLPFATVMLWIWYKGEYDRIQEEVERIRFEKAKRRR